MVQIHIMEPSVQTPFKSISKINSLNLKPGDKVLFKKDRIWYGETLEINNDGTKNHPIIYSSYGTGKEPIINANKKVGNGIRVTANNITIIGLIVTNATNTGFNLAPWGSANNLVIENCISHHNLNCGIRLATKSDNVLIVNTTSYYNDNCGISIGGHETSNVTLKNCTTYHNGEDGMQLHPSWPDDLGDNLTILESKSFCNGEDGIDVISGSYISIKDNEVFNNKDKQISSGHEAKFVEFFRNYIHGVDGNNSDFYIANLQNVKVWSNIVLGGDKKRLFHVSDGDSNYQSTKNIEVFKNTFIWNGEYEIIRIADPRVRMGSIKLESNILTTNLNRMPSKSIWLFSDTYNSSDSRFTSDYNFYGPGLINFQDSKDKISWYKWRNLLNNDINGDVGNPRIYLDENEKYNLEWNSPAIDTGNNFSSRGEITDFYGNPIYGIPDIGAIEYQPPYHINLDSVLSGSRIRIYSDGKFRYTSKEKVIENYANISLNPTSGWIKYNETERRNNWMDLEIVTWNKSGNYEKIWKENFK